MKKKVCIIFGTRPEIIKLFPLIKKFESIREIQTIVISTGQHEEMLRPMINLFNINIHYDLQCIKKASGLPNMTSYLVRELSNLLSQIKPDIIIIQGDTTSAFCGALAGFYSGIDIAHVEAGLRSNNLKSPFPEEANRKLITSITKYHFCPTDIGKKNLLREGILNKDIYVTGNTVIDSLKWCYSNIIKNK
jgi:UDP-N-acetylglucosamine 2-epimerase (non-hydrolysing)